jgi:hypothetical protein
MSNKKNWMPFQFPLFDMEWDLSSYRNQWNEFKANVDKAWDQFQAMQEETQKAWKEQWEAFFGQCMEMQKDFAETLPDQKIAAPGMPVPPLSLKEAAEKAVELQEKANAQAVKQNDAIFNLHMKGQKQVKEMVTGAVKNVEEKLIPEKASEPAAKEEPKEAAAKPVKKAEEKPEVKPEVKPEPKKAPKPAAARKPKKAAAKAEVKADAEKASQPAEEQK